MRRTNTALCTLSVLVIAGSLGALGGCSRGDSAEKAVNEADLEFRSVSAGSAALPDRVAKQAFDASAALTQAHAGSDEAFGDAAAVSLAMSKLGQASIAVDESTQAQKELSHMVRLVHAHISEWVTLEGVARASASFRVDTDATEMESLIAAREGDVRDFQARLDMAQREIEGLEAQISQLEARAAEERETAAGFELRMRDVSATESAELAQRVREHTLRADALELESIRVSGVVGQKRPAAKEIELQVLMAQNQIALLRASIEELAQQARDARTDASDATREADAARDAMLTLVDEVESFNDSSVTPAGDKVVRMINDAAATARKANASAKVSGAHALSSAQQMLARAYARQSRGEALLAGMYETLAASGMSGSWGSLAQEHAARAQELRASADESFQNAAGSLRRGRSPGGSSEARDSAVERLESLGGVEPEVEESFDDGSDEG